MQMNPVRTKPNYHVLRMTEQAHLYGAIDSGMGPITTDAAGHALRIKDDGNEHQGFMFEKRHSKSAFSDAY